MRFARAVILLLLCSTTAGGLYAQSDDAAAWFGKDARASAYVSVQADIQGLFDASSRAGVPLDLLMDKLKEGASKRVPPGVLLDALRAEAARLSAAQDIVARRGVRFARAEDHGQMLKAMSLLMVAGVPQPTMDSFLAAAAGAQRNSANVLDGLKVILQVKLSTRLADPGMRTLGTAILASRLPPDALRSIPAFMMNAGARGVDADAAAAMVASALSSGGGIIQMEDALQKASHRASSGSSSQNAPNTTSGSATHTGSSGGSGSGSGSEGGQGGGDRGKDHGGNSGSGSSSGDSGGRD